LNWASLVKPMLMHQLGFQGVEEAFHVGVILAVARAIHAGRDPARAKERLVAVGRAFDAAIRMEEQSRFGVA
jgi:dTDP-4-dehydrorhamnose 3,5-epimerase-like enzyme